MTTIDQGNNLDGSVLKERIFVDSNSVAEISAFAPTTEATAEVAQTEVDDAPHTDTAEWPAIAKFPDEQQAELDLETDHSSPFWTLKRTLGAVAVTLVFLGGAFTLSRKGSHDDSSKVAVTPALATPGSADNVSTGSAQSEQGPTIEADQLRGNVNLAEIKSDDSVITDTRPNGDIITVPKLRNLDVNNPDDFAHSAMALTACALTTNGQECKDELSTTPKVQASLNDLRNEDQIGTAQEANNAVQVIMVDRADDPARFKVFTDPTDGTKYIGLASGTLYYGRYADNFLKHNDWQTSQPLVEGGLEATVDDLRYYFDEDPTTHKLSITRFVLSTHLTKRELPQSPSAN